jgi:hypothetical protein
MVEMKSGRTLSRLAITGTPSVSAIQSASIGGLAGASEFVVGSVDIGWDTGVDALGGLTTFTLAYWVYWPGTSNLSHWGQGTSAASTFCETLGVGNTTGPFLRGSTDQRNAFTEIITQGEWQHIAWRMSSTGLSYVRNGVVAQTQAVSPTAITAADASFIIGAQRAGSAAATGSCNAYWADVRLYDTGLTDDALRLLYRNPWDLYATPSRRSYAAAAAPAGNRRRRLFLAA